jgi:hypothetical protein
VDPKEIQLVSRSSLVMASFAFSLFVIDKSVVFLYGL